MFQSAWASTASTYPQRGARSRTPARRLATAMPTPMPMNEVNSGWANGLTRQRSTKVAVSAEVPPGPVASVPL